MTTHMQPMHKQVNMLFLRVAVHLNRFVRHVAPHTRLSHRTGNLVTRALRAYMGVMSPEAEWKRDPRQFRV